MLRTSNPGHESRLHFRRIGARSLTAPAALQRALLERPSDDGLWSAATMAASTQMQSALTESTHIGLAIRASTADEIGVAPGA